MPAVRMNHKPKREDAKARELADFKRENVQLKRKIARLEKLLLKYETSLPVDEVEAAVEVEVEVKPLCPKCKGDSLAEISMNNKIYVVCREPNCLNRWSRAA